MSTRGSVGFHRGGTDKIMYNHSDSYPSYLGVSVARFVQSHTPEEMNEMFDRIVLVNREKPPTKTQIEECEAVFGTHITDNRPNPEWYDLLHPAQGDLEAYAKGLNYMKDSASFLKDSLFCEWGYVINLDTNTLEIYRGFQHEPDDNRYYINEPSDNIGAGYYNCKLIKTLPFSEVTEDSMLSVERDMEREENVDNFGEILLENLHELFPRGTATIDNIVRHTPQKATINLSITMSSAIWSRGREDVIGTVNNAFRRAFGTKHTLPDTDVGLSLPAQGGYKTPVVINIDTEGDPEV